MDNKHSNIHIIGVSEGEEKEQEFGNLFEKIMKEHFSNLVEEIDMQVQEAQRIPNKIDLKRLTPRHIIIKMPKLKDKELSLIHISEPTRLSIPSRMPSSA